MNWYDNPKIRSNWEITTKCLKYFLIDTIQKKDYTVYRTYIFKICAYCIYIHCMLIKNCPMQINNCYDCWSSST